MIKNYVQDLKEDTDEDKQWEYEEAESVFRSASGEKYEDEDDYRLFHHSNSTKLIKEAISFNYKHGKVTLFKVVSILWVLLIIVLSGMIFINLYYSHPIMSLLFCIIEKSCPI